jgi:type IV pilus assembly protein PilE
VAVVQQAQERWRSNNSSYADSLSDLAASADSPSGYYTISIDSADAGGYVISAVGNDGKSQADDADCRRMSVRLQAGALAYAGCGSCSEYSYSNTNACWAR